MEIFDDPRFVSALLAVMVMVSAGRTIFANYATKSFKSYVVQGLLMMAALFGFAMILAPLGTDVDLVADFYDAIGLTPSHGMMAGLLLLFGTYMATDPAGVEVGGLFAGPKGLMAIMAFFAVIISGANDPAALVWILAKTHPETLWVVMGASLVFGGALGWFMSKFRQTPVHTLVSLLLIPATYYLSIAALTSGFIAGAVIGMRQTKPEDHFQGSTKWETGTLIAMFIILIYILTRGVYWDGAAVVYALGSRLVLVVAPLVLAGCIHALIKQDIAYLKAWTYIAVASIPAVGVPAVVAVETAHLGEFELSNAIKIGALACTIVGFPLTIFLSKRWANLSHELWGAHPISH